MEKHLLAILATALLIILISSCRSITYQADNLPPKQLHFGVAGGFAGSTTTHILLDNGQVFLDNGKEITLLTKIKKRKAKAFFTQYTDGLFADIKYNHPSNLSYFIEMKEGDQAHQIVWSTASLKENSTEKAPDSSTRLQMVTAPIDERIPQFYQDFLDLINNSSNK